MYKKRTHDDSKVTSHFLVKLHLNLLVLVLCVQRVLEEQTSITASYIYDTCLGVHVIIFLANVSTIIH
jgi:hypothetical protein